MVNRQDPATTAAAAREALRQLAHATMQQPEEMSDAYAVLGALSDGLVSLRQVLDQLSVWHEHAAPQATDASGDRTGGRAAALLAGADLQEARILTSRALQRIESAWSHHGAITWHASPQAPRSAAAPPPQRRREPRRPDVLGR